MASKGRKGATYALFGQPYVKAGSASLGSIASQHEGYGDRVSHGLLPESHRNYFDVARLAQLVVAARSTWLYSSGQPRSLLLAAGSARQVRTEEECYE